MNCRGLSFFYVKNFREEIVMTTIRVKRKLNKIIERVTRTSDRSSEMFSVYISTDDYFLGE